MPSWWVPVEDKYEALLPPVVLKRDGGQLYADFERVDPLTDPGLLAAGAAQWQREMVDQGYFNKKQFEKGVLQPTPAGRKHFAAMGSEVRQRDPAIYDSLAEAFRRVESLPEPDIDEMLRSLGIDPADVERGWRAKKSL